ncbi:two pore domain potassium channel family protein [Priestia megaterium]|nr:two pore domain potassium channel family protein [Priestia megaterium]
MTVSLILIVVFFMIGSMKFLFEKELSEFHFFSIGHFFVLFYSYITVLLGFSLIYTVCEMGGISVLSGGFHHEEHYFYTLFNSMYFSAITLFSVGYGDMYPVGVGKMFATLEALVGYMMPAVFVIRTVSRNEKV